MGDYTNMSAYYDAIMTSGYYDYQGIVDSLLSHGPVNSVLEIGCGTGLILEELARRQSSLPMSGMDLTQAMLTIAKTRLAAFPNVSLSLGNVVNFDLQRQFDMAFSYGGVWYFVIDGDKEPFMVSHLPDDADNRRGLEQLSRHVAAGGRLLLGVQGPHYDYERVINNGMTYSQKIAPGENGFTKHYYLADNSKTVMAQTLQYRTYSFAESRGMLAACGFEYEPTNEARKRFLGFKKQ